MEVENNFIEDKDSDSDTCEDTSTVKVLTEYVEMNGVQSNNELLIVGSHGNASGFLKISLYTEFKNTPGSLKGKFFQINNKDKSKPKKLVAELYQFKYQNNNALVILTKEDLNFNNYKTISDMLLNVNSEINKTHKISIKKVICLDSKHYNDFVKEGDKSNMKNQTFFIKNKAYMKLNENTEGVSEIPVFNGVVGFSAYLINKCDILNIPCVYYLASTSEYKVCLDNLKVFNSLKFLDFFKGKLEDDYLKSNKIDVSLLLKEFNHYQTSIFT